MEQHRRITWHLLVVLATTIGCSVTLNAQTVTGTLQGTVSDTKGAVVPGVEIVARNVETGQERRLTTNGEGYYSASFLLLGRYTITASGQGFASVTQENIEITLNQTRVMQLPRQVRILQVARSGRESEPIESRPPQPSRRLMSLEN